MWWVLKRENVEELFGNKVESIMSWLVVVHLIRKVRNAWNSSFGARHQRKYHKKLMGLLELFRVVTETDRQLLSQQGRVVDLAFRISRAGHMTCLFEVATPLCQNVLGVQSAQ